MIRWQHEKDAKKTVYTCCFAVWTPTPVNAFVLKPFFSKASAARDRKPCRIAGILFIRLMT
jgi:hypothetical protein